MEHTEYKYSAKVEYKLFCFELCIKKILIHQYAGILTFALLFPVKITSRGMIHEYKVPWSVVPYCYFIMFVLCHRNAVTWRFIKWLYNTKIQIIED